MDLSSSSSATGNNFSKTYRKGGMSLLEFNDVLTTHAVCGGCFGLALVVLPHRIFSSLSGEAYSHVGHEIARCYGALTLAQAWLALRTRSISDGRVRQMLAEANALCYLVTALALARAAWSAPRLHGILGAIACTLCLALAALYAYFRCVRKLKHFELPGHMYHGGLAD